MAIQSFQLDPTAVSSGTFNTHTHSYRKITKLGVDGTAGYGTPTRVDIVDASEVHVADGGTLREVGITVTTSPTSTPG